MKRATENGLFNFANRNGILDDPVVRKLVLASGVSQSGFLEDAASKFVLNKSLQHFKYPFKPPSVEGDVDLGRSFDSYFFQLPNEDLAKHLLAVGQSGSGKTTLFYSLYEELGCPVWFFDLKQDYRHLSQEHDLLVLPWTSLKYNPLKPPVGVTPRRWAQVFSEIFGHSTALLSGSKNYLLKKVIELYRLYGLFDCLDGPYPSLHELQLLIEKDGINYVRTASNYRDRLLNRLEALNLVAGTVFDCSTGYSLDELLEKDVVFEFDGLSRDVQNFLMEILFASVYEYRLGSGQRGDRLRHVFVLDEGKQVFSVYKERQDAAGIPEIDQLTAKMREFGEGLIVGDQEASKLTDSIKANTYTKVLLPTGDQKQFLALAESMNLSQRQMEFASELDVGEAVIQVGNGSPVPVKLENNDVNKTVSDTDLEKLQAKKWNTLSYTPREPTSEFRDTILQREDSDLPEPDTPEDPNRKISVSNKADRFLRDVVKNPFKKLTNRYEGFSSQYMGNQAKDELIDQGLLIERQVRSQNGRRKLLELTKKGREYVEDNLDLDVKEEGRGGIIHRYWQNRIKEVFREAGWNAYIEKFDADVYVNMYDSELAIEVAMGDNPREIQHVSKHLDKGFTVWLVCRNEEIRDRLKQRIKENDESLDSVVFRLFREFNNEQLPPR